MCMYVYIYIRGGSRNSSRGGGSGPEFFEGGGGVRVQVHGNFHILTSKKKMYVLCVYTCMYRPTVHVCI